MKVFIQTNKQQYLASKVSAYSFKRFGLDVELMNFEDNTHLKNFINKKYFRNKKFKIFKDDLQSFTLLRFLAPKLNNFNDYILVIDPDIFALKDPKILKNEIDNLHNVYCTFYNNSPRSEMMLIDAKKITWDFNYLINKLFNHNLDYQNLMNLSFDQNLKIKKINNKFNSHDFIDEETVLLHTTNRLTQPWKEGLKIDFERHNFSYSLYLKNLIKKYLNKDYDTSLLALNYQKHPDTKVINTVKNLFLEAKKEKFISEEEINLAINNKFVSNKILI